MVNIDLSILIELYKISKMSYLLKDLTIFRVKSSNIQVLLQPNLIIKFIQSKELNTYLINCSAYCLTYWFGFKPDIKALTKFEVKSGSTWLKFCAMIANLKYLIYQAIYYY